MGHELLGMLVRYKRPTITGTETIRDAERKFVDRRNVVEIKELPALIVGVDPQGEDDAPILHLAFLHPERLEYLSGSGWRDALDRAVGVRHGGHDLVMQNPNVGYYLSMSEPDWPNVKEIPLNTVSEDAVSGSGGVTPDPQAIVSSVTEITGVAPDPSQSPEQVPASTEQVCDPALQAEPEQPKTDKTE